MEAQAGAEVRQVHIVYFLSRKGRIEHPHLLRVHHLSINGVRLRDVKKWLAELRGKEIPESFSWSYKRRYKAGYVWQDLLDDDLITPISHNEYVLQGSEISVKEEKVEKHQANRNEMEEESPSTLTDDCGRVEVERSLLTAKQERPIFKVPSYSCFDSTFFSKKRSKDEQCRKSNKGSKMLKNLMSCGDVETKDRAVVNSGARVIFGGSQSQQQSRTRMSFDGIEGLDAAYKPVNKPNCSICGKPFKPEKMQAHMKSCKGLKALSKSAAGNADSKLLTC